MGLTDDITEFVGANPLATAIGAGVVGVGAGVAAASIIGGSSKKKTRKSRTKRRRINHSKRGWAQDRRLHSKQKWEVAYRKRKKKRKSKSRGRIHYARKTGQPYIILASGKAKFIKGKRRK